MSLSAGILSFWKDDPFLRVSGKLLVGINTGLPLRRLKIFLVRLDFLIGIFRLVNSLFLCILGEEEAS